MADNATSLADRAGAPIERPLPLPSGNALFGSDVVAETLRALEVPFIALNPGSSYRGLHDSLVNYLGNVQPQMLLCLHEEHAVAIAHGYAKVTGRPMAAAVHSNVGLMHATMALFNAWCDRMPVLLLGATGPVDAPKRRAWIDWIHTARDQGALIRDYTKWDDQPASAEAARESLLRAYWLANSAPKAPVYINLDAGMQEAPIADPLPPIDASRFVPDVVSAVAPEQVARAVAMLRAAKQPVILMGRGSHGEREWADRVALAETLRARVMTDLKCAAVFPTDHPLHVGAPSTFLGQEAGQAIAAADVILSLDWVDLAGALKAACGTVSPAGKVIAVTLDHQLHNGWSMDHQALPPADLFIAADADTVVAALACATAAAGSRADRTATAASRCAGRDRRDQRGADDPGAASGSRSAAGIAAACVGVVECRACGRCGVRWTTSAAPVAPASAAGRGFPSAPRWDCAAAGGCRSRCAATATS